MKNKFKHKIFYFLILICMGLALTACGNKNPDDKDNNLNKENTFYIDSFTYEIVKNESSVSNELSYSMSFDIGFSLSDTAVYREFIVRISGTQEKSFHFTIDYCNTEHITLSQSTAAYPYALLNYSIPKETTTLKATVRLKISTADLIDDINKFLKIDCYNNKGYTMEDKNHVISNGCFVMSYADTSASDIIHYSFNDLTESYEVVSVITKSNSFAIPATYKNYPVRTIDQGAFKGATHLEELTLPTSLSYIPEGLLNGMSNLKTLSIPYVGQRQKETGQILYSLGYLFGNDDYANGLKFKQVCMDANQSILEYECSIPKSLTKIIVTGDEDIPYGAFSKCNMLKTIELTGKINKIADVAFSGCVNVDSIVLPDTIKSIGYEAFAGFASQTELKEFRLPNSITYIGENAFSDCENMTFILSKEILEAKQVIDYATSKINSISIPFGVEELREEAFKNCNSLKTIALPKSLTSFGKDAFIGCEAIEAVLYDGAIENWANITFNSLRSNPLSYGTSKLILSNMSEDSNLVFTDNILQIKDYAFAGIKNIKEVALSNVTSIGASAFLNTAMTSIAFGNKLETIKENAFSGCNKLTTLDIPNTVTHIGKDAFMDTNITSLSVPFIGETPLDNTFIGYWFGGASYAFNKTSLPSTLTKVMITIATSIPAYAFSGCSNIKEIELTAKVLEIKNNAFESCTALIDISLSDTLETIGNSAFLDCISLKQVVIPSKVKTIGKEAFSGCAAISVLELNCTNATIKQNAFFGCSSITSLELHDEVTSFEDGVFRNCRGLMSVIFHTEPTISSNLFTGCSNIEFFQAPFIGNASNQQEQYFAYFFGAPTYPLGTNYVPSKLKDVVITCNTVSDNAFYGLQSLQSITIKTKQIGSLSLYACSSLEEVSLEGVETISDNAFLDCKKLKAIHLDQTLTHLGIDAFNQAFLEAKEKLVYYNGSIEEWALIDFANDFANPMAFADDFITCVNNQEERITKLIFSSITQIKPFAFYGFSNVEQIKLSDTIQTIGASAFSNMMNLSTLETGKNLISIDRNAFKSDANLKEVSLYSSLKSIGEFAFMGCAEITTLKYYGTIQDWVKINFANQTANIIYASNTYMLDDAGKAYLLEEVHLDETVKEISSYAFYAAPIKALYITNALEKIGDNAFKNCLQLETIYFNGSEQEYYQIVNNTPFSNDVDVIYSIS